MKETISYNQAILALIIDNGKYDGTNAPAAFTRAQEALRKRGVREFDRQYDWENVDSDIILVLETKQWRL